MRFAYSARVTTNPSLAVLRTNDVVVGFYELNPFPGCNQLVVSNHTFIHEKYRGKGYGKEMAQARVEKARELGYNYMLATVVETNAVQRAIMEKVGYRYLDEFSNKETGNTVCLYGKELL